MNNKFFNGLIFYSFILVIWATSTKLMAQTENLSREPNSKIMKSFVSIFEIPATDLSRAVLFYEEILGVNIERMDFPDMQMGLFPYEGQVVTGVIMKGEGYQPSVNGVTIYLNGGENLQIILDKVEKNGGKIIVPKTPHADESGFFAIFLDPEGNKMGLHSPK
jgi:predicted enzyme related to lactoylglutathione lyase